MYKKKQQSISQLFASTNVVPDVLKTIEASQSRKREYLTKRPSRLGTSVRLSSTFSPLLHSTATRLVNSVRPVHSLCGALISQCSSGQVCSLRALWVSLAMSLSRRPRYDRTCINPTRILPSALSISLSIARSMDMLHLGLSQSLTLSSAAFCILLQRSRVCLSMEEHCHGLCGHCPSRRIRCMVLSHVRQVCICHDTTGRRVSHHSMSTR